MTAATGGSARGQTANRRIASVSEVAKSALIGLKPDCRSGVSMPIGGDGGDMHHRSVLPFAAALLAAMVALVTLAGLAAPGQATTPAGNASNATVAPGQQVSAIVDVGEAELETEVEGRALGRALSAADSPAARARVLEQRVDALDGDVEGLERRFDDLRAARANGTLSEGGYRARVAGLAAELQGRAALANATADASAALPTAVRRAKGVDFEGIELLSQRASQLGGGEVAAIARDVAGPAVGRSPGPPADIPGNGPPADAGRPGTRGPASGDNRTTAGGTATPSTEG